MVRRGWSGVVGGLAALAVVGLVVLTNPVPFHGSLSQTREAGIWSGKGISGDWIVMELNFSSPSRIAASTLVITVNPPSGESITLANGSKVPSVQVRYFGGFPPYLAELSAGDWWTGFNTVITNPDGSVVVGVLPPGQPGTASMFVASGALLNMTFPAIDGPTGYTISVTVQGNPGSATVTLGTPG